MTVTAPEFSLAATALSDPDLLLAREWLVTNGLGGYASASLFGVATRRYHGWFVPDLPLKGRSVLMPRLDDRVESAEGSFVLSGAEYEDGSLQGDGAQLLQSFQREWQTPVWTYRVGGTTLEKRVVMPYGQNTVYIQYALIEGPAIRLTLRPFIACRMHDAPLQPPDGNPEAFPLIATRGRYELPLPGGLPSLKLCLRPRCGVFVSDDLVSRSVSYRIERDRGSEHLEDLFSPGYFSADLQAGETLALVASVEAWESLQLEAPAILEAESQRLRKLVALAPAVQEDEFALQLALAADQFIVLPGSRPDEQVLPRASGDEARTVIAGYHWFGDWGRDTMISFEGLTLCTGRHQEARAILRTFAQYIQDGLIPNLFPEGARQALYHTADATLWYFHAIDRYVSTTEDRDTLMGLYPILKRVIDRHVQGTRFGIGVDARDGLLKAGAPGYQVTWMDAKVDGWVVTPRRGKPVEIQALWYNALRLMEEWGARLGESSRQWADLAGQAEASFHARYWHEPGRHLFDVVDGEQGDDPTLRPNQLFTMSLRYPILRQERWRPVVDIVTDTLLTPVGLRSLAPGHRDYKPTYSGDLRARDAAYHQGTVWAWLIGHYIDARLKVYPDRQAAHALLRPFQDHLHEAGIGTISEIFDAEPPYRPRGCIAQAWSVAEVLRAYVKTKGSDE
jgi:predicted glycogen debranching enzyme